MSYFKKQDPKISPATKVPQRATPEVCPNAAEFARNRLHFHPDPLQEEVLNAQTDRLHLLCSRQWGKSTVAAAKALHFALTNPNATILIASASQRQSSELLTKISFFAYRAGVDTVRDTAFGLRLQATQSRILALPENPETIRGYAANLILIDEAAFVSDALFNALRPSLAATNGALWLLSSAGDTRGFFYTTWEQRHASWKYFKATAADCPRISEEFLEKERILCGDQDFQREYFCEFLASRRVFMSKELIDKLFEGNFPHLDINYAF